MTGTFGGKDISWQGEKRNAFLSLFLFSTISNTTFSTFSFVRSHPCQWAQMQESVCSSCVPLHTTKDVIGMLYSCSSLQLMAKALLGTLTAWNSKSSWIHAVLIVNTAPTRAAHLLAKVLGNTFCFLSFNYVGYQKKGRTQRKHAKVATMAK